MSNEKTTDIATIEGFKSQAMEKMKENGFATDKIMREISFALQHFAKNDYLNSATPISKLKSVVNISQVGLTLNPVAKEAYLVPRFTKGAVECVLEPSYVGLQKLLTDAGSVQSIVTNLVYENDKIEIDIADNQKPVKHFPELNSTKRGAVIGVYSLATLHNGIRQVEYMDIQSINDIRERSESYKSYKSGRAKSCIWESDYAEMCRKTCVKRIYKYLPRTERMTAVDEAISLTNQDFEITDDQRSYMIELAQSVGYTDDQMKDLKIQSLSMSADKASQTIEWLKDELNSLRSNPDFNLRTSATQASKHLSKLS
jgi:phage RecT family recombinase